jgi:hypothetical protein
MNHHGLFTSPVNETPSETGERIRPAPGPLHVKLTHYATTKISVEIG